MSILANVLAGIRRCACGDRLGVLDVRERSDGTVRRRHFCPKCGARYSTVEIPFDLYERLKRSEEQLLQMRALMEPGK
jgi:transcriptional regulator NrdR family protein